MPSRAARRTDTSSRHPGRLTESEAQRIARLNILMALGNALYVADMELCENAGEPFWRAVIAHGETNECVGELHIPVQKGKEVTWHPAAAAEPVAVKR